ncbi:MAG: hypothetical protein IPJ31_15465 [Bacteroidetes bacterium]|nr:hypothetical protein [Bacteroidota bacterium]
MENYIEKNKKAWNDKTEYHLHSEFYNVTGFIQGESSLNEIELANLGDLQGKSILHLQCLSGQDSIALSRFGCQRSAA